MANTSFLEKVELYATRTITNEFSTKLVYHDIIHAREVIEGVKEIATTENLTEKELEITLIAAWLYNIGFKNIPEQFDSPEDFFKQCHQFSLDMTRLYLTQIDFPKEDLAMVLDAIRLATPY